ncbi:hypothetical protein J3R83DRAFT_9678 [Lanmaoa asiatica]|nr:hypothetical protein J3R83DRAFT_9678 [Lanmaoa asiatica]
MLLTLLPLVILTDLAAAASAGHWVNTWVTMLQLTEYQNVPNPPFTLHTSIPAPSYIRIRISNAFGVTDLPITQVGVALPLNDSAGTPEIVPSSMVPLTFSGNQSIIIPNGAQILSDPTYYPLEAQSMVTVGLYTEQGQQGFYITGHPGSRTTS